MPRRSTRRTFLTGSLQLAAGLVVPSYLALPRRSVRGAEPQLDVLIAGGTVIDGSGAKRVAADVGIRGQRIVAIGPLAGTAAAQGARQTINATGCIVAPGFIDMHSHSDRTLLTHGDAQSAVRQGATTHVTGNCGSSPAPRPQDQDPAQTGPAIRTFGDYLARLREQRTSINVLAWHSSSK